MASIFEISKEILSLVDPETGEIEDIERLEELELERDEKIDNVACWIKDLKHENTALTAEKKALTDRITHNKNLIERLEGYLADALDGQKFKSNRCTIGWRKSDQLVVEDGAAVPEEYLKMTVDIDKAGLKKAVKGGLELEGVSLVEKQNIQVE